MTNKVLLAIPCYNCAPQLQRLIPKVLDSANHFTEVVFFENQSADDTLETLKNGVRSHSVTNTKILQNRENYGLGGSFKNMVEYGNRNGFSHLCLFHGDDQASTEDLVKVVQYCLEKELSCVFGARFMPDSKSFGYSRQRDWGNRTLNKLFSWLLSTPIYELGSGLNIYKLSSLPKDIPLWPNHMAFDINLLTHYVDGPDRWEFFPISWYEDDQESNADNIKVGLTLLKMLLRYKLGLKNHNSTSQTVQHYDIVEP